MAEMILLFLSVVTLLSFPTTEAADNLSYICPNTTVFTPNSTFESNRNLLLSSLSSNSTRNTGFYNATAGSFPAETVYGLFLCRGDATTDVCKACVATATSDIVQLCPVEKEVVIWYDDCMLRYSNTSFFSVATEFPSLFMWNTGNVSSEPNRFNQVLGESMAEVATEAANDVDRFATREANFTALISVYSLGQCTQDLSSFDCNRCLRGAIAYLPTCCSGKIGGRVLNPSCNVRFEQYPFNQNKPSAPEIVVTDKIGVPEFKPILISTLNGLLPKVIKSADKFATNDAYFTASTKIYTLGQCTQDLPTADCSSCLTEVIKSLLTCCANQTEATLKIQSTCNVTFQLYPFAIDALNPPPPPGKSKLLSIVIAIILAPVALCVLVVVVVRCFIPRLKRAKRQRNKAQVDMTTVESLQFDLGTIEAATKKFSDDNKLGEGGFGQVFKGTLNNGQEIAAKRLSKNSGQGIREFQNEVLLVAKLQHRNLVRLLGFCLGEETVLVYEFVPNKSLDYFLFDSEKRELLDWPRRCTIIGGIARGILYLHEDSRLRVIHRDLKASNILLDANMHPKISDFGMAKMFGLDDQTQGSTRRIVGTYGYMAPEYAMEGLYSIKSDVFSFGILLLEILTGRKNFLGFHPTTCTGPTLLSHAWQLWNEGGVLELMDPLLKDSCNPIEFLRYIHIGLLCVQENANIRPTMSSVVLMLKSESISLTKPERPAFITGGSSNDHGHTLVDLPGCSVNGLTVSDDIPR